MLLELHKLRFKNSSCQKPSDFTISIHYFYYTILNSKGHTCSSPLNALWGEKFLLEVEVVSFFTWKSLSNAFLVKFCKSVSFRQGHKSPYSCHLYMPPWVTIFFHFYAIFHYFYFKQQRIHRKQDLSWHSMLIYGQNITIFEEKWQKYWSIKCIIFV